MSINMSNFLTWQIESKEVDTLVSVYANETQLLFHGESYTFATTVNGQLQLRLNFGANQLLLHTVKAMDGLIVLIPACWEASREFITVAEAYLSFSEYIRITKGAAFIFPKLALIDLWQHLAFPTEELDQLEPVEINDILMIWLLGSGYDPQSSAVSELSAYAIALRNRIVAQEPSLEPPVKDIITGLLENRYKFHFPIAHTPAGSLPIEVYIAQDNDDILEWRAMIDDQQYRCILNERYSITISAK